MARQPEPSPQQDRERDDRGGDQQREDPFLDLREDEQAERHAKDRRNGHHENGRPVDVTSTTQGELRHEQQTDHRQPDDRLMRSREHRHDRCGDQREPETGQRLRRGRDRDHGEHADPHPDHLRIITGG